MPSIQLSRQLKAAPQQVTTEQRLTELVSWDGIVRATFTTFTTLEDGTSYPGDVVIVSRDSASDSEAAALLDQAYALAQQWLSDGQPKQDIDLSQAQASLPIP